MFNFVSTRSVDDSGHQLRRVTNKSTDLCHFFLSSQVAAMFEKVTAAEQLLSLSSQR